MVIIIVVRRKPIHVQHFATCMQTMVQCGRAVSLNAAPCAHIGKFMEN